MEHLFFFSWELSEFPAYGLLSKCFRGFFYIFFLLFVLFKIFLGFFFFFFFQEASLYPNEPVTTPLRESWPHSTIKCSWKDWTHDDKWHAEDKNKTNTICTAFTYNLFVHNQNVLSLRYFNTTPHGTTKLHIPKSTEFPWSKVQVSWMTLHLHPSVQPSLQSPRKHDSATRILECQMSWDPCSNL
jgi:hypothetical protein